MWELSNVIRRSLIITDESLPLNVLCQRASVYKVFNTIIASSFSE